MNEYSNIFEAKVKNMETLHLKADIQGKKTVKKYM